MTTATQATDNAVAAAAAERPDTRRITEADPDFQRLHAQTVRKLLASLRAYVRALRVEPASHHPQLATAYVRRQVGILRAAYAQAHREGVRDYYAAFSRRPGRYLHLAPSPAPHVVKRRLGFYAPSVAKMAHEALLAWGREQRAAAAAARLAESAAPEAHTGVMVAFMLAPQTAKKLAIVGGEPAEDMHITLAFLGEKTDMSGAQVQQLKRAVAGFAAEAMPLRARITGVDRFAGKPDDDTYPCFAAVDIPGIQRWRAQLVKYLKADGLPVDETFRDYHPHITLAYVPKGEPLPVKDVSHLSLLLDRLTLALGDERHTWRIGDEQYPDTSAAAASAKHAENITQAITLAGDPPANTGDFLDGIGPRVNLQAEITWSGFNDGYVDAGGTDPANPYTLLWWDLEPMAKHCFDCPPIAAGSPYDPPWVTGGNVLDATPGDGHTECGAACKCSLRYGAGAGEADPRGTVWDSPNAPPPPPAPDGQPGQWPNIAGVDDMSTLSEEQQRALQESFDAYRQAFERWEAIRGTLPSLPDMFGVAGGEGVAAAWPAWESLSPAQQVALKAVFDALAAYDAAAGSPTLEEVETGLAGNAASLDAIAQRAGALQDELNALVQAARAEEQQTKIDLFAGGPLKVLWQKFVHNLDQYFDWLLSRTEKFGEAAEDPAAGADAADDDGDTIRLYNPNHYPAGSRQGGQFAPKGGGGGGGDGGGEEEALRGAGGGGTSEHPLVHARGVGGGGGAGSSGNENTYRHESLSTNLSPTRQSGDEEMRLLDARSERESPSQTKARIAQELADRLRDDPAFIALQHHLDPQYTTGQAVSLLVSAWAMSANHPLSAAIQQSVRREFGLEGANPILPGQLRSTLPLDDHAEGLRSFVHAVYDHTQEWLARNDITEVVAARGMHWRIDELPHEEVAGLIESRGHDGPMDFRSNPLSSWSVDVSIARSFSRVGDVHMRAYARIPASRIFSTSQTGMGCKGEGEIVILGGHDRLHATIEVDPEFLPDEEE